MITPNVMTIQEYKDTSTNPLRVDLAFVRAPESLIAIYICHLPRDAQSWMPRRSGEVGNSTTGRTSGDFQGGQVR
jgi:hypothetical protein